jgi:hypothetical protein
MNEIKTKGPIMAELAQKPTLGTLQQFKRKAEEFVNQEETINALTKKKVKQEEEENDKEEEPSTKNKRKVPKTPKKRAKPFQ